LPSRLKSRGSVQCLPSGTNPGLFCFGRAVPSSAFEASFLPSHCPAFNPPHNSPPPLAGGGGFGLLFFRLHPSPSPPSLFELIIKPLFFFFFFSEESKTWVVFFVFDRPTFASTQKWPTLRTSVLVTQPLFRTQGPSLSTPPDLRFLETL